MSSNNDYVNRIQVATSKTRTTNPAYNANIPPIFDFANSFSNDDIKKVEDAASFRVSPAQDAEYMSAVESGDMEKAIEMLSDAFLAAYPDNKLEQDYSTRERTVNGRTRLLDTLLMIMSSPATTETEMSRSASLLWKIHTSMTSRSQDQTETSRAWMAKSEILMA